MLRHVVLPLVLENACLLVAWTFRETGAGRFRPSNAPRYNRLPDDYVIATGGPIPLNPCSHYLRSGWTKLAVHVDIDASLRPSEIAYSGGKPDKALEVLGWKATVTFQT